MKALWICVVIVGVLLSLATYSLANCTLYPGPADACKEERAGGKCGGDGVCNSPTKTPVCGCHAGCTTGTVACPTFGPHCTTRAGVGCLCVNFICSC